LTETGLWFRQIAQDLLAEVARVSGEAQAIAEANSATLRFAVTHALSFIFILRWLRALEAQMTIGPIQLLSDVYKRWEAFLLQSQVQFVLSHAHEQCMCRTSHHRRANSSAFVPRLACEIRGRNDTRIKLWATCQALLDSRHSNQHEPCAWGIEDRVHLLEAGHFQTIGFIHQYEARGITHGALSKRTIWQADHMLWFRIGPVLNHNPIP
jgi:DNA-binding transcriptional LysR family regulator